jgi:uncharacterized protein YpuA (DUF1002 family)
MYKNALATAGVTDANIIVAGPFPISGTAALVGTFKAYKEMTGESLDDAAVDAALDELVTTGELEESLDGDSENLEAMIADLKQQIADGTIQSEEEIEDAIEAASQKYDINLSKEDIQKLLDLLKKIEGLDLDWSAISSQASAWADKISGILSSDDVANQIDKIDQVVQSQGFWDKVTSFLQKLWNSIKSFIG